jgi:toxin ParE1/3/4
VSWRIVVRPEVEQDLTDAAGWYDAQRPGLGSEFIQEVFQTWDALSENRFLNSRRHPSKNIRWRFPERFPYRVIYEVLEENQTVVVAAVLHAARQDKIWKERVG